MEKRNAKVLWSKSGKGSDTTRLTIPVSWVRKMELSREERIIEMTFDEENGTITLKKCEVQE